MSLWTRVVHALDGPEPRRPLRPTQSLSGRPPTTPHPPKRTHSEPHRRRYPHSHHAYKTSHPVPAVAAATIPASTAPFSSSSTTTTSAAVPVPALEPTPVPSKRKLTHAFNALHNMLRPKKTWHHSTWTDEIPLAATSNRSVERISENWWDSTPALQCVTA
ncbi:hypothetical protein BDF14DRAFT_1879968 [Spinellus fusiger]|nr:hypothetical protein BDF14DRAFT_1879968 [Spinellus fusiger]